MYTFDIIHAVTRHSPKPRGYYHYTVLPTIVEHKKDSQTLSLSLCLCILTHFPVLSDKPARSLVSICLFTHRLRRFTATRMVKNTAVRNGFPPRKHHTSFSGFFSRILPSNRPEQGGTARAHDITGETDSAYIDLGMDPNDLTEWNLARERTLGSQPSEPSAGYQQHRRGHSWNIPQVFTRLHDNTNQSPQVPQRTPSLDLARAPRLKPAPQERHEEPRPMTRTEISRMLKAKEESRRSRRSLKESGDWLGVQGADPYSGEFAVLTPTSTVSSETTPPFAKERLAELSRRQEDAKLAYDQAKLEAEEEREKVILRKGQSKIEKMERVKEKLRQKQRDLPTWSQHKRRWSSAAEPDLSPIPQSIKSDKAEDGEYYSAQSFVPTTANSSSKVRMKSQPRTSTISHSYRNPMEDPLQTNPK